MGGKLSKARDNQADPRLLEALASLNRIGAAINRISPRESANIAATLRLIAESAIKVVPEASAVIYACGPTAGAFDVTSRVSAGEPPDAIPHDTPRPNGIGARAIRQRRRVLSYEEPDLDIHPAKAQAGAKAMACFPLIVADEAVGALYIYLHQERHFTQLELLMLDNFVNQAAMAIYQARRLTSVQRDLARKEEELNRLRRAGLLISSRLRLEETLEAILQMAIEVTGACYGIFRLVDPGSQHLVAHAVAGTDAAQPLVEALPIDDSSVMGWVARRRQPVCIRDLHEEPWAHIYRPLYANLEMRSELAVPLIGAGGRLEGVLNLESPQVGGFSEEDSHLLQSLATQAVIAIQEARLLDALQEVAQLLLTQPCEQVLSRLVELACHLLDAAASALWTLKGDELVLQVASAGYQRGERLPLHGSLAGQAVLTRAPTRANDVRTDPRFNRPDLAREQNWSRALVVPLLTSDALEPLGAFSVYSTEAESGCFAESEWGEKVLTCLAHYAALAVQNDARQRTLREIQEQHAIAETFAAVGDVAANALHHLNNKVGSIPARIQGIQDKCRATLQSDPYLATNLAEIERSAAEALEAVRESLAHLYPIHPSPANVAACITAALAKVHPPERVRIQTFGLDCLPTVMTGPHNLTMVFANLIGNAVEAMQEVGTITVSGTFDEDHVYLTVSDDGPGIPPEWHTRIFELCFSGRATSRPAKLGFGLWWVKTLMMRLGGSISVESDGAHGATFHLRLPRAKAAQPGMQSPHP